MRHASRTLPGGERKVSRGDYPVVGIPREKKLSGAVGCRCQKISGRADPHTSLKLMIRVFRWLSAALNKANHSAYVVNLDVVMYIQGRPARIVRNMFVRNRGSDF